MHIWKTTGDFLTAVAGALCFHCQGPGFIPASRKYNLTSRLAWPEKKTHTHTHTRTYKVDWNHHHWASVEAQTVKNPPTVRETWDQSLVGKIPWRREWQPTLVFLPGGSHGQRSLAGYSLWDLKLLNTTEHTHTNALTKLFEFLFLDVIISSWTYSNFHEIKHSFVNVFRWYFGLKTFFFFLAGGGWWSYFPN